jgi:hypothetical protein
MTVSAQHNIVGGQRIRRSKKAEIVLDDQPFVLSQRRAVLPLGNVAVHGDFLRHPVIGATGQVFVPGPMVLERHQLVDISLAVDYALILGIYATSAENLGNVA